MSQESDIVSQETQTVAEVDRIRDIIFGPQMRNYEQQFKRLASQVDRLGKQLEDLTSAFEQQTSQSQSETRQALDDFRQEQSSRLDQQVTELRAETRKLANDMRKQGTDLRDEIMEAIHALEDGKTNRLDLSDLLIEMGTRLKQQMGLADLLGQLEDVTKD